MTASDPHAEPLEVTESDGLALPHDYIGYEGGLVVRTPICTQQFPSGEFKGHLLNVRPRMFGDHTYNPELAPDTVRLKKYGEPAEKYDVVLAEQRNGGDTNE